MRSLSQLKSGKEKYFSTDTVFSKKSAGPNWKARGQANHLPARPNIGLAMCTWENNEENENCNQKATSELMWCFF